jgi:hypothetical protein
MKKYILMLLSSVISIFAQGQGNIWYFGNYAGLDFNSGSPVPILDGSLYTEEGCATISNASGKLLFYTDGITIWNRKHKPMPNGIGLLGHTSSTQSGVIVPKPGDPNLFYVFTVSDKTRNDGFRYSVVDMRLDGGLGDVTDKNIMLCDSTVEKITAVVHQNDFYIWVIMHEWNNDLFRSYLITPSGIQGVENSNNQFPIISKAGSVHSGDIYNKIGYMKASPDASKLALAKYGDSTFELFNFNNKTGQISHILTAKNDTYVNPYGIEFSNDGRKLFVSFMGGSVSKINVYDLSTDTPSDIIKSEYILASVNDDYYFGALQIASDKKIYCAYYESTNLHVIENPTDLNVKNIRITQNKVDLKGRGSMWGLPTFIQSYFSFNIKILNNMPLCEGDTIHLKTGYADEATYKWTGPNSFSSSESEIIIPNSNILMTGMYKLITSISEVEFRDSVYITVNSRPKVNIGADREICLGESVEINSVIKDGTGNYKVVWIPASGLSDSTIANVIAAPTKTTEYIIGVYDVNGCTTFDTMLITVNIPPKVIAGKDVSICSGDFAEIGDTIISGNKLTSVTWRANGIIMQDNRIRQRVNPQATTEYLLSALDENGCQAGDTVIITVNPVPFLEAGKDILICDNQPSTIGSDAIGGTPPYIYQWYPISGLSSGSISKPFSMPDSTTNYYYTVKDRNGCIDSDSITVFVDSILKSKVYVECKMDSAEINSYVKIPLKIEAPSYFYNAGVTGFEAILRFNATVILPVGFNFEFLKIEDGYQYIKVTGIVDSAACANGILSDMVFYTAYGNSTYTDIEVVDFRWTFDKCMPKTSTDKGCVDIYNICNDFTIVFGLPGTIKFGKLTPNPANNDVSITMESNYKTVASIEIYDLTGRKVIELEPKFYPEGQNAIDIPLNTLQSGFYNLLFRTSFGIYTNWLIINR